VLQCAPGGPNDYIYVIIQPQAWAPLMEVVGREDLIEDPDWATPEARLPKLESCFHLIEGWTVTKTKFEVMEILNAHNVPCGPVLSMKELAEDPSLRATETVVEVEHPERGKFLTVGNPIKLSDSPTEVTQSPLLGEHTEEIMREIGYGDNEIAAAQEEWAIGAAHEGGIPRIGKPRREECK
jgi:formyl-CoA transferase